MKTFLVVLAVALAFGAGFGAAHVEAQIEKRALLLIKLAEAVSSMRQNRLERLLQRERLEKLLLLHEGRRRQAYVCPGGCWTIGIGHNLEAHESPAEMARIIGRGASEEEIEKWFRTDVSRAIHSLESCWGKDHWWRNLTPARKAVLQDMCFNLGGKGLTEFRRMTTAVARGDYARAEAEMYRSKWASQVKGRAFRLGRMMRTGEWPPELEKL